MQGDFRLGQWLVCPKLNTVQADGRNIRLEPKFMRVLVRLADRAGDVVSKAELMQAVWVDTFVTDDVLTRAISELRRLLGDDAKQPHVIETVARGGYRIIAPVQWAGDPLPAEDKSDVKISSGYLKVLITLAAVVAVAIAVAVAVILRHRPAQSQTNPPQPIAVLPLENTSAAKELDFLRVGLADDIANTLSYYPSLSMRPFATTNRYAGGDVDLQKAAREMRVANIVTGHFVVEGDQLQITLEAVDATNNRVLWRDTLQGTTHDLIGIQQQITTRVQHGLIAALGMNAGPSGSSSTSHNPEAYEFYLRAVSENDFDKSESPFSSTNKDSIRLLERAVALDPGYASAWAALGHLYYYDIGFGGGGEAAKLRAKAALQRAVALDPGRIDAASDLINIESEEGELNRAYDDITKLLRLRPESGAVHLVFSYVLWYGGLVDEAAAECEKTRSLDPGTTDLASCSYVFMAIGRYERAQEYLQLVSGTEYEKAGRVEILVREGKKDEALQELRVLPMTAFYGRPLLEHCLLHGSLAGAAGAEKVRAGIMADDDPFGKYMLAAWDSQCGRPDLSSRELQRAIEQNYCAYPQMETDPLLANARGKPEFAEIRSSGIACQQRFLEHRKTVDLK
jgi:DNA-binding winged helix-turn-helix (wHTH) protein/TolB-like protein